VVPEGPPFGLEKRSPFRVREKSPFRVTKLKEQFLDDYYKERQKPKQPVTIQNRKLNRLMEGEK
jgi:hypothetical protein